MRQSIGVLLLTLAIFAQNPSLVIVNGASFKPLVPVSPSSIVSAFPVEGQFQGVATANAPQFPLPTSLAGTEVLVNGVAAPLFYTSSSQINFQVPRLTPTNPGDATIAIRVNGVVVSRGIMTVFPTGPGLFSALNENSQPNSEFNPAVLNSVLQLYAVGLGALNVAVADGAANPSSPPATTLGSPTVWIGFRKASVEFSGGAPGFVGLNQLNVRIPNTPALLGKQWLFVVSGGIVSDKLAIWINQ
jgi:uncharacterized protein (TIGR03437 family)